MLNRFFNDGRMDTVAYAHIGKYAENVYWDKASGLLDQMACAVGGLITIDFLEPAAPKVEQIDFDFASQNHSLIIVQTGKGHADLSADYSSVPNEMKKVARFFGKEVCAEVTEQQVIDNIQEIRAFAGDRSVMRALHFFEENKRVEAEVAALKEGRFADFLANTRHPETLPGSGCRTAILRPAYRNRAFPLLWPLRSCLLPRSSAAHAASTAAASQASSWLCCQMIS